MGQSKQIIKINTSLRGQVSQQQQQVEGREEPAQREYPGVLYIVKEAALEDLVAQWIERGFAPTHTQEVDLARATLTEGSASVGVAFVGTTQIVRDEGQVLE